jgi:hypothetical protein
MRRTGALEVKTLKCPICGTFKSGVPRVRKTCSRACGQILMKREHGPDWHKRIGTIAGKTSAQSAHKRTESGWRAKFPTVPVELGRAVYTKGYNSGHAMGKRTGYAKGYEQALKDMGVGTEVLLGEYRRRIA